MSVARLVNADESTWQQLSTVVKQAGEVKTSWDDPPVILTAHVPRPLRAGTTTRDDGVPMTETTYDDAFWRHDIRASDDCSSVNRTS